MTWRIGRLQQRAASAAAGSDGARLRIAALLATQPNAFFTTASTLAVILYMVIKPGSVYVSGLMWLLAYLVTVIAAKPSPVPLARVMLLPLGADRARMGQIIGGIWLRESWARLTVGISIGLVVHTLSWWLEWPAFLRSPLFSVGDSMAHLVWIPIAHAVGLCGIALSAVWLASALPRWL